MTATTSNPVTTAASHKARGLGRAAVSESLRRLQRDGIDDVVATITDGNVESERLLERLGFARIGVRE